MARTALQTDLSQNRNAFSQDILDFFQERRAGHLSKWLYSVPQFPGDPVNGTSAWAHVVVEAKQGSPYYPFRDERSVIQYAAESIAGYFPPSTRLIDLGPGSEDALKNKVFPILKAANHNISEYVAVDVSTESLDMAMKNVSSCFPNLGIKSSHHDFILDNFTYGFGPLCEASVLFGLTLFNLSIDPRVKNLPEYLLTSQIQRIASHMVADKKYLVLTQDTNQDIHTLRKAYMAISPYYRPLLYRIVRDLNVQGDFDPQAFTLDVDFFEETKACSVCFVAQKNMRFSVDRQDQIVRKNQRLYFHNAFKFSSDTFINCARQAGFEVIDTIVQDGNPCLLHILAC